MELLSEHRTGWAVHPEAYLLPPLREGLLTARVNDAVLNKGSLKERKAKDFEIPLEAWSDRGPNFEFDLVSDRIRASIDPLGGLRKLDGFGLSFDREQFLRLADINPSVSKQAATAQNLPMNAGRRAGAKADAKRWEQFAAALAVTSDLDRLDLSSETKAHKSVADYLTERGHEDVLGIDTVRSLIRRFKAWRDGNPYLDDFDFENGLEH